MPASGHCHILWLPLLSVLLICNLAASEINRTVVSRQDDPFDSLSTPVYRLLHRLLTELQSDDISSACRRDTTILLQEASEGKKWALKILDSMGKPGSGVLEGGISFPGFFSECIESFRGKELHGKYCLAKFHFASSDTPHDRDPTWALYSKLSIGLCVPSSCVQDDVKKAATAAVSSLHPAPQATVQECYTERNAFSLDLRTWLVIAVFSVFLLLVIAGTLYDLVSRTSCQKKASSRDVCVETPTLPSSCQSINDSVTTSNNSSETLCKHKATRGMDVGLFLRLFSLTRNCKQILNTSPTEGSLGALHGIRFLSMAWIIVGHSFSFASEWLFFRNPKTMSSAPKDFLSQAFANGTFAVDTFFFLSGFLVAYTLIREMKRNNGNFSFFVFYLHRYLRMTPVMMMVIAFSSTFLRYLGSGPAWREATVMYDSWCRDNWWLNALYLQNFIHREHMCLSHTWYSAVDMQFYIISPFIIYACHRNVFLAAATLITFLLITSALPIIFTILYHLPAVPSDTVPQSLMNDYYASIYIKPYCRMGPYLVGIALAYFICRNNGAFRISKKYKVLGWTCAAVTNMAVIYSMGRVFNSDPPTDIEAAIYNGFARTAWAITIGWLTFSCTSSQTGVLNQLLSTRIIVPLSRLTYSAYLIHPVVMAVFYGTRETVFDFSLYWLIYVILGNLVITYIVSFIVSLLFESPIMNIEKIFRGR